MRPPSRLVPSVAVLALFAIATSAIADVDMEIDAKAKVSGSLASDQAEDVYRFQATAGSVLSITAIGKSKAIVDLDLRLSGPQGDVDLTTAPKFKDAGKKLIVKKLVLAGTGEHVLRISGNTGGEYQIKVGVVPQKKFTKEFPQLVVGVPGDFAIAAPAGSRLTLKAKPTKGSPAVARFGTLTLPGSQTDLSTLGKLTKTGHIVKVDGTASGGDLNMTVDNSGADGGVVVSAVVKGPKVKTQKLDVRGSTAGGSATSKTIDDEQGGTVEVDDPGGALDGLVLEIPPNALPADTRIEVRSAPPQALPTPGDQLLAGPAIFLGPEGTTFATPVDIWVPYDAAALPVGEDPRIFQRKADGSGQELTVLELNTVDHLARVQTSSFSTFFAFAAKGLPNLANTSFWSLFFEIEAIPDDSGADDSRERAIFHGFSTLDLGAAGDGGSLQFDGEDRELRFINRPDGTASVTTSTGTFMDTGTWDYRPDGMSISLTADGEDGEEVFLFNHDGTLLMPDPKDGDEPNVFFDLFIRKPSTPHTTASLAGTYWFAEFSFEASMVTAAPVPMGAGRGFGTVTLGADGSVTHRVDFSETFWEGSFVEESETARGNGTFVVSGVEDGAYAGSVIVTFPDEDGGTPDIIRFLPDANGNLLIGSDSVNPGDESIYLIMVRQGSGMRDTDVVGAFESVAIDFEFNTYNVETETPDFEAFTVRETLNFGDGVIQSDGLFEHGFWRDTTAPGGVGQVIGSEVFDETFDFDLTSSGRIDLLIDEGDGDVDDLIGAISPSLDFGFVIDDPKPGGNVFGISFFFLAPVPTN